uniref:Uncharacterized protein n=1 Tax=Anolis carolinensis TaxID=28377 RepID=G1KM22_ANOCA
MCNESSEGGRAKAKNLKPRKGPSRRRPAGAIGGPFWLRGACDVVTPIFQQPVMDTETIPTQEPSLTVNEQVIVMSGHETIRVLEVGVDAPLPTDDEGRIMKTTSVTGGEDNKSCPPEPNGTGREAAEQNSEKVCGESEREVKTLPEVAPAPIPGMLPFNQVTNQQTQTLTPVTVQAAPQYCRSSGKSAGAGCVDISCSNGRCPPRIDGCLSYWGNFQITSSQFASCCSAEYSSTSPFAAKPAYSGPTNCSAKASSSNTDCAPTPGSANHFATAYGSVHTTSCQAIGNSNTNNCSASWICV